MSCFYLPKKLKQLPSSSKKAWDSFTSSLSPKLRDLRNNGGRFITLPRSLTKTATRLFDLRPNKHRRSIPKPQSARGERAFNYYNQYNYQHLQPYTSGPNSPATVYVDRLFGESLSSSSTSKEASIGVTTMDASTSSNTIRDGGRGGGDGSGGGGGAKKRKKVSNNNNNNNNWKEVVSSMPNIRGVDERAEEFISKFRQEMQIQREQSLIEFQEMLARSA